MKLSNRNKRTMPKRHDHAPELGRRMFLRGAGGITLGLPTLASLLPRTAQAAAAPRRLIAIKSYSTQTQVDWYPTKADGGYELRARLADGTTGLTRKIRKGEPYTWAPLSDFKEPSVSRLIGSGFNPFLDKMLLVRGLDFPPDTNHNDGGMLGNYQASDSGSAKGLKAVPTIDQVLAHSPIFYRTTPLLRSLHLSPGTQDSFSFTDNGNPAGPIEQVQARMNPLAAYLDVFGRSGSGGGAGEQRAPNLNFVFDDYKRYARHKRLSSADRQLLERHMSFLSELEARMIPREPNARCQAPAEPPSIENEPSGANLGDTEGIAQTYELMIDTLVAAVMCDHTRLFTLDTRKALSVSDGVVKGWYHANDDPGSWHGEAHDWGTPSADQNIFEINKWIAEEVVLRIIEKLDVEEGEGRTFLDNSVVFWGNELGFNHINIGVPALLAGGAGGFLDTGRYLDYTDWSSRSYFAQHGGHAIQGVAHNRLLVSILQAMGLSPSDYERDGRPGYGSYEIVGKRASLFPSEYSRHQGDVLPGIVK